jgi:aspartyl-tRNA(Asn)/glutamyl-tRNA(Gln) amidotransferase subunit A
VDPQVSACVQRAVGVLADLGAQVEQITPPVDDAGRIFRIHWYAGAATLLRTLSPEQRALVDPGLQDVATEGAGFSLREYQDAVKQRGALGQRMQQFMGDWDLLVTPALPIPAFPAGQDVPDPDDQERWADWTPFSYPFNLTQQPACSVPCGFTDDGLPVGLQIVGPMHDDALVLRAARAYESMNPIAMPKPA